MPGRKESGERGRGSVIVWISEWLIYGLVSQGELIHSLKEQ